MFITGTAVDSVRFSQRLSFSVEFGIKLIYLPVVYLYKFYVVQQNGWKIGIQLVVNLVYSTKGIQLIYLLYSLTLTQPRNSISNWGKLITQTALDSQHNTSNPSLK